MLTLMQIAMYFAKLYVYTGGLTEQAEKNITAAAPTETLLVGFKRLNFASYK